MVFRLLTIKQKFYLASFLTLISMIGILILGQYTTQKLKTFDAVSLDIARVQAGMLMLRRNEKDFLARNDLKYSDKFKKNFSELIKNPVSKLFLSVENADLDISSLTLLKDSFDKYNKSFFELISIQKKIGLHSKDGLYGALRKSVHEAEENIDSLSDQKLRSDMLQLRRKEKDFKLRLDMK